jgi:hypothetical protein
MEPDPQPPAVATGPVVSASAGRLARWFRFPRSWREVRGLGWRMIAAFLLFYLVRDLILYILLPWLVYRGVTQP